MPPKVHHSLRLGIAVPSWYEGPPGLTMGFGPWCLGAKAQMLEICAEKACLQAGHS